MMLHLWKHEKERRKIMSINRKIKTLKKEIEVKDKIIASLVHECAEHKIKLPDQLIAIIQTLYIKEGNIHGNQKSSKTEKEIKTEN